MVASQWLTLEQRLENAYRDIDRYTGFVLSNERWAKEARNRGDTYNETVCREQARHWQHSVHIARRRVRMLERHIAEKEQSRGTHV